MNESIKELSRANHTTILRAMGTTTGSRIAELIGVSEATVSRFKDVDGSLEKLSALAAACGVRFVRADAQHVEADDLKALAVLAQRGLHQFQNSGFGGL